MFTQIFSFNSVVGLLFGKYKFNNGKKKKKKEKEDEKIFQSGENRA